MAYVTPPRRMTDEFITDAIWNQDIVDNTIAIRALAALTFILTLTAGNR